MSEQQPQPVATNGSRASLLTNRHRQILQYFPTALGVDDFMARVEIVLCGYGFTGDNSIAMTNLCRDEVTTVLKDKIEASFGSSFNTNGLGAILTCGVTGIQAGLSHSPVAIDDGRERYVFFSFPHIAIDSSNDMGAIHRPGRPGRSCACGALQKALGELQIEGVSKNCKVPGVHDPLDPEFTILKQRLARRIRYEQLNVRQMSLADITAVAERTITDDLEYLIEKCVDAEKADFAVVAGVQVHNWGRSYGSSTANLEFVAPSKVYVSVNGERTYLDLMQIPSLTPRQINILAQHSMHGAPSSSAHEMSSVDDLGISDTGLASSTLQSIPFSYMAKRMGGAYFLARHPLIVPSRALSSSDMDEPPEDGGPGPTQQQQQQREEGIESCSWPAWQSQVRAKGHDGMYRDRDAPTMESPEPQMGNSSSDDEEEPDALYRNKSSSGRPRPQPTWIKEIDQDAPPARTSFTSKGMVN